jgi:hypothetical protein
VFQCDTGCRSAWVRSGMRAASTVTRVAAASTRCRRCSSGRGCSATGGAGFRGRPERTLRAHRTYITTSWGSDRSLCQMGTVTIGPYRPGCCVPTSNTRTKMPIKDGQADIASQSSASALGVAFDRVSRARRRDIDLTAALDARPRAATHHRLARDRARVAQLGAQAIPASADRRLPRSLGAE